MAVTGRQKLGFSRSETFLLVLNVLKEMPPFHVDLVGFILINMLITLTPEACFRIFREPEAGMKRHFSAKAPILIMKED